MNILQINHYVGPERFCPAYRPTHLAREWVKQGHSVTIVGASYSHLFHRFPSFRGNYTVEEIEGIRYIIFKTPRYYGNSVGRVVNIFAFLVQLNRYQKWLVQECQPNTVIAGSTYLLDTLPALSIARQSSAKLIREIRDLWPLTLIELGSMSRHHPWIMLLQWAENFAYRNADCVVTTLPNSLPHMKCHGLTADRWAYIPQGVDVEEWQGEAEKLPEVHLKALHTLQSQRRFIVGYTGSHGISNALDVLVKAAHLLQDEQVAFVFVGQGPEKQRLERIAYELDLKNIVFLRPVTRKHIRTLLSSIDAAYIGWKRHPIYHFGISPNKLMDYMMCGIPIIHSVEAGNDIVAESGCGFSVPPENPESVANAIRQLIKMEPVKRKAMGARGRDYVMKNHDYRVIARHYLELM